MLPAALLQDSMQPSREEYRDKASVPHLVLLVLSWWTQASGSWVETSQDVLAWLGGKILGRGPIILYPALSCSTKRKGATKLEEHQ